VNESTTSKSFVSSLGKPTAFSGSKGTDKLGARDWLTSISDYLTSSKVASTDEQRVQFAETYLQGEARRAWHVTRTTMSEDGITYAAFQQAIIDRWDPASSEINAMNELDDLRQTGTLTVFITKFDRICSLSPDISDREKVHKFLRNCNPAVATLIATDPQTKKRWTVYQDLKQYALNYVASLPPAAAAATALANPRLKRPGALGNIRQMVDSALQPQAKKSAAAVMTGFKLLVAATTATEALLLVAATASPLHSPVSRCTAMPRDRHSPGTLMCSTSATQMTCAFAASLKYDRNTAANHRQHCTAPPRPDREYPPGYDFKKAAQPAAGNRR